MPWCKKNKTSQLQKPEKAHKVSLSNCKYTRKPEGSTYGVKGKP